MIEEDTKAIHNNDVTTDEDISLADTLLSTNGYPNGNCDEVE